MRSRVWSRGKTNSKKEKILVKTDKNDKLIFGHKKDTLITGGVKLKNRTAKRIIAFSMVFSLGLTQSGIIFGADSAESGVAGVTSDSASGNAIICIQDGAEDTSSEYASTAGAYSDKISVADGVPTGITRTAEYTRTARRHASRTARLP